MPYWMIEPVPESARKKLPGLGDGQIEEFSVVSSMALASSMTPSCASELEKAMCSVRDERSGENTMVWIANSGLVSPGGGVPLDDASSLHPPSASPIARTGAVSM